MVSMLVCYTGGGFDHQVETQIFPETLISKIPVECCLDVELIVPCASVYWASKRSYIWGTLIMKFRYKFTFTIRVEMKHVLPFVHCH